MTVHVSRNSGSHNYKAVLVLNVNHGTGLATLPHKYFLVLHKFTCGTKSFNPETPCPNVIPETFCPTLKLCVPKVVRTLHQASMRVE